MTIPSPQEALDNHLHLGANSAHHAFLNKNYWDRIVKVENNNVFLTNSDCGQDREALPISFSEYETRVRKDGLWKQVGLWSFVPYDDPAASDIAYAEKYPKSAGRLLYEAKQTIKHLQATPVSPEKIAELFCDLDADEQARFYNHIDLVASKWSSLFCFQLQAITDSPELTYAGRRVMDSIGEYSHWGLVPTVDLQAIDEILKGKTTT